MAIADVPKELEIMLLQFEQRIALAERQLEGKDLHLRVKAAAELRFLKEQRTALQARLTEAKQQPEDAWTAIKEWFRADLSLLEERLNEWVARH